MRPSKKSIAKIRRTVSVDSPCQLLIDPELQVAEFHRTLTGWANHFCSCPVSMAFRVIDTHVVEQKA